MDRIYFQELLTCVFIFGAMIYSLSVDGGKIIGTKNMITEKNIVTISSS